jgi:HSP20 family protein
MTKLIHDTWNPLTHRDEFLTPFDSLFDDLLTEAFPSLSQNLGVGFFGKGSYPKVDVIDCEGKVLIEAEIPGLTREDVSVELEENILTISGNKNPQEVTNENTTYIRRELKRSSFKRSFTLGDNLSANDINADFENGILAISIPKKSPKTPKVTKIL